MREAEFEELVQERERAVEELKAAGLDEPEPQPSLAAT